MAKLKKIFKDWRVLILIFFIVFSYITLNGGFIPHFWDEGVTIRSVAQNSSAAQSGIPSPTPQLTPLQKERILSFNGKSLASAVEYYELEQSLAGNSTVILQTTKKRYTFIIPPNNFYSNDLGLRVYDAPTSNLRKGLDLEGGTRVLLRPAEPASKEAIELTVANLRERLNVYGLSDIIVRSASDLSGNYFVQVEIAGVTEDEVKELLSKQGKFEAKISNETVFFGGEKDITYVCRSADCSGIDTNRGCGKAQDGSYACTFFFSIALSPEAAQRQADITNTLTIIGDAQGSYLSEKLFLYLDNQEVDSLNIGAELKGRATTDIQISGSGVGRTEQEAVSDALNNMKRLQTIIVTGSLPVKLEIVKFDTISPTLGKEFLYNIFFVGVLALLAVSIVVTIRYRRLKIIVLMLLALLSEIFLILGFSALFKTNLDLAAIAGIIIVIGSGVNHLIIITDGTLVGEAAELDWKTKIKNAMSIVFGAYLVNFAGLIPLWFAGAGLLKGFALTTILGASLGVLIARPAYAAVLKLLLEE